MLLFILFSKIAFHFPKFQYIFWSAPPPDLSLNYCKQFWKVKSEVDFFFQLAIERYFARIKNSIASIGFKHCMILFQQRFYTKMVSRPFINTTSINSTSNNTTSIFQVCSYYFVFHELLLMLYFIITSNFHNVVCNRNISTNNDEKNVNTIQCYNNVKSFLCD